MQVTKQRKELVMVTVVECWPYKQGPPGGPAQGRRRAELGTGGCLEGWEVHLAGPYASLHDMVGGRHPHWTYPRVSPM